MPGKSLGIVVACLCLGAATPALAQSTAQRPALSAEQAIQLFAEAGFPINEGRPVNRCGKPSNPRIAFIDLNADERAEAYIADVDPSCYGKPGAYFALLTQEPDGHWKRVIAEDGIVAFERERTSGWNNLTLDPDDSACPGSRRFNGQNYGAPTACGTFAAPARPEAAASSSPTARTNEPLSQEKLFNWTEDQTPEARALPPADRDALFRAAGAKPIGAGKWTGCPDDPSGNSQAQVAMVQDLNGDGRPEALIRDSGTFCNGMAGVKSTALTKTPAGSWEVMYVNQGFANFLVSRGADGFPDIEAGLPGFCFPYFRWNGTEYALIARLSDEGKACDPF